MRWGLSGPGPLPPITLIDRSTVASLEPQVERLEEALAEAVAEWDPVRAAGLVLAARLRRPCPSLNLDPAILLWLLVRVDDPVLLPCLAGAAADPLSLLLRFLESEPLADARASALVCCILLLPDGPLPDGFVTLARRAVEDLHWLQCGALGQALEKLEHPELSELAQSLRPKAGRTYHSTLEMMQRGLAGDFEEALLEESDNQPYRRTEPKVGRNDPCVCGSGLKFKKCCQGKPKVPAGRSYSRWQPPHRLNPYLLPLHQLVQLRPQPLDSETLRRLVQEYAYRGPLDQALEALDELLARDDLKPLADEILDDFLLCASQRMPPDMTLDLLQRISSQASPELLLYKELLQTLLQPQGLILDGRLAGLVDEAEIMGDVSYALRRHRPAMSLMLARQALLLSDSELDCDTMLSSLSLARAGLGLSPEDPMVEVWGRLHEDEEEEDEHEQAPDPAVLALQRELTEARQRLRQLEAAARPGPPPRPGRSTAAAPPVAPQPEAAPTPDPEVKRLRQRLQEVKGLLRERNQERARLRQELNTRPAEPPPSPVPAEVQAESLEAEGEAEFGEARLPPLLPEWTKTAAQELRQLPAVTARLALRLTGELAAGLPSTWNKTKPIQAVEGLHSIRLGLNHRMLFSPELEAGTLRVHHLVTRGDHDRVVKQLGR